MVRKKGLQRATKGLQLYENILIIRDFFQ
jgi:hypothetical protein